MEYNRANNGWVAFAEHIWFVTALGAAFIISVLHWNFTFWFAIFVMSFALMLFGALCIVAAKMPTYRKGQFCTWGAKSVPTNLRRIYRFGWKLFLAGIALSLCLLLSR